MMFQQCNNKHRNKINVWDRSYGGVMRHYNTMVTIQDRLNEVVQCLEELRDHPHYEMAEAEKLLLTDASDSIRALRKLVHISPYRGGKGV
mgnify:CR=1 FL=1